MGNRLVVAQDPSASEEILSLDKLKVFVVSYLADKTEVRPLDPTPVSVAAKRHIAAPF